MAKLNRGQALQAFRGIAQRRNSTLMVTAWETDAQAMLTESKSATQGTETGICRYTVGNDDFVVKNITRAECEGDLGGTFIPEPPP
jgi:hypothetical protein